MEEATGFYYLSYQNVVLQRGQSTLFALGSLARTMTAQILPECGFTKGTVDSLGLRIFGSHYDGTNLTRMWFYKGHSRLSLP